MRNIFSDDKDKKKSPLQLIKVWDLSKKKLLFSISGQFSRKNFV